MSIYAAARIWLLGSPACRLPLRNLVTKRDAEVWRGNSLAVHWGIFAEDLKSPISLSNIAEFRVELRGGETAGSPVYASRVLTPGSFNAALDATAWAQFAAEHAKVTFSSAEMSPDLNGKKVRALWLVAYGITNDQTPGTITYGAGPLYVYEDVAGSDGPPVEPPGLYYTKEEIDAIVADMQAGETAAAGSAAAAASSANSASSSAAAAAGSAAAAAASATTATTQAAAASASAAAAAGSATAANAAANSAASSATSAGNSATTATIRAQAASSSATNAATSATNAQISAENASGAQNAAENAQSAAETAQAAAEAAQGAAETAASDASNASRLTIGAVTTGPAAATITGPAGGQLLNLVLPVGPAGPTGPTGPTGPAGTTTWSGITGKPTTIAGFGITDAISSSDPNIARRAINVSPQASYSKQLRDWNRKLAAVLAGVPSTQATMLVLGDSWSGSTFDWLSRTTPRIQQIAGSAGPGYVFIDNNTAKPADPNAFTYTRVAPWVDTTPGQGLGFDGCETVGTAASSSITWTLAPGVTASAPVLHYALQTAGSVGRYRFNGGSWTNFNTTGTPGYATLALAGAPTSAGYTLEIGVATSNSDGLKLFGIDFADASTVTGIRVHRGAHGGFSAASYLGASSSTNFAAGVSALNPDLTVIFLGTNDQNLVTAAQYGVNIQTLITRLRAVKQGMDILLVAPCENLAGRARPMTQYRDQLRALADTNNCAFIDLISVFGESVNEYNDSSPRVLFSSADTLHPTTIGIQQIGYALQSVLLPDSTAEFNRRTLRSGSVNNARIVDSIGTTGGVVSTFISEAIGNFRYQEYGYGANFTALWRTGWNGYWPNTWFAIDNVSIGGGVQVTANNNLLIGNTNSDKAGSYGIRAEGTTVSTSSTTGAILFGNGVAATNIGMGGGNINAGGYVRGATIRHTGYTVATLPAGVEGDTAYVTDAVSPTYRGALTGGGSTRVPVFFNGTSWEAH